MIPYMILDKKTRNFFAFFILFLLTSMLFLIIITYWKIGYSCFPENEIIK